MLTKQPKDMYKVLTQFINVTNIFIKEVFFQSLFISNNLLKYYVLSLQNHFPVF